MEKIVLQEPISFKTYAFQNPSCTLCAIVFESGKYLLAQTIDFKRQNCFVAFVTFTNTALLFSLFLKVLEPNSLSNEDARDVAATSQVSKSKFF